MFVYSNVQFAIQYVTEIIRDIWFQSRRLARSENST